MQVQHKPASQLLERCAELCQTDRQVISRPHTTWSDYFGLITLNFVKCQFVAKNVIFNIILTNRMHLFYVLKTVYTCTMMRDSRSSCSACPRSLLPYRMTTHQLIQTPHPLASHRVSMLACHLLQYHITSPRQSPSINARLSPFAVS